MTYANNKGADQRSLISTFVVRCLDSIIPIVSTEDQIRRVFNDNRRIIITKYPPYLFHCFYIRAFKPLPSFCVCAGWFVSYMVANPEDQLFRDKAHFCVNSYPRVFQSYQDNGREIMKGSVQWSTS